MFKHNVNIKGFKIKKMIIIFWQFKNILKKIPISNTKTSKNPIVVIILQKKLPTIGRKKKPTKDE